MIKKYLVFLPFIASCNRLGQSNMETQVEAQAQSSEKERKLWLKLISLLKTALDLLKASGAIPVTTTHLCYEDFINNFHTLKKQFEACPYPALNGRCFRLLFQHYGISYFTLAEVENEESCRSLFNALKEYTNIDVNEEGASGFTPLNNAIDEDNLLVVELLLSHPKIEVNEIDPEGHCPLHLATCFEPDCNFASNIINIENIKARLEIVKALMKHKYIDPNTVNPFPYHPTLTPILSLLREICDMTRHPEDTCPYLLGMFEAILQHKGIDVNKLDSCYSNSPKHMRTLLHYVLLRPAKCLECYSGAIKAILQKPGLDLSIRNEADHTALDLGMVHENPTIRDIFKDYCNKSGS